MRYAAWIVVFFLSLVSAAQDAVQESSSIRTHQDPNAVTLDGSEASSATAELGLAAPAPHKTLLDPSATIAVPVAVKAAPHDFNQDIYYRNKVELSVETGWLPVNIPFPFDFMVGDAYENPFRYYTLAPTFISVRWHLSGINGPSILRGNTELIFSANATVIPKSAGHIWWVQRTNAESRYFAFDLGMRRNFIRPNWRISPYSEFRLGVGNINAKGPVGMLAAQGQDLTFTLMLGSGFRYNFNSRISASAGVSFMHISNAYLSEPAHEDYGINVYGPVVGINIRLGKARRTVDTVSEIRTR